MRKLLLYIRASREDLKMSPEGTLKSQRQRLEDYVKSRNSYSSDWGKVVGVYMDEARSAKDTNRPQFQEMLRAIELRKGDTILVTELSRLSRSLKDFCGIWDFLKSHKAQFLSLREQFDTTSAAGEMMVFSLVNLAQFERKQTSERVCANFQARAMRGLSNGGPTTLGYDPHPEKKGHLVVNEIEAQQVRRIFQIFQEKGSLTRTLEQMKIEQIFTKKKTQADGTYRGGCEFDKSALWRVLRNRHYIGDREIHKRFRDMDADRTPDGKAYQIAAASWPGIVSPVLFQSVQEILENNAKKYKPESRTNFDYTFSSVVFCFQCGKPMVGVSGRGKSGEKHYYYSHKGKKGVCEIHSVDALELHRVMRGRFKKLAEDPAFVDALYKSADTDRITSIPDNERHIRMIEGEIEALNRSVKGLMASLEATPNPVVRELILKELEGKGGSLKAKSAALDDLRSLAKGEQSEASEKEVFIDLVQNWDRKFLKLSQSERKQFVRKFLRRIEVSQNQLRAQYNYDKLTVAQALNVLDFAKAKSANQNEKNTKPLLGKFENRGQRVLGSYTVLNGRDSRI